MFFSLIPFILILLSLAAMIVIVARKFSQLTLLDVDNIPGVKQSRQKEAILKRKAEKEFQKTRESWKIKIQPIIRWLKQVQLSFRKYVGRIEREVIRNKIGVETEKGGISPEKQVELKSLVQNADQLLAQGDYEKAEEQYISVIKVDPQNVLAYQGLAEVYLNQGQSAEAEETLKFLLKLGVADDQTYAKLGHLCEKKDDLEGAIEYYQQAVLINDQISTRFFKLAELLQQLKQNEAALEAARQAVDLEPNNPKYLDIMAELAILAGDKKSAEDAWNQLRMVNPENQKLEILRDRINQLLTAPTASKS